MSNDPTRDPTPPATPTLDPIPPATPPATPPAIPPATPDPTPTRRRSVRPASPQPEAEAAWRVGEPTPDAWTPRPWVPAADRRAVGIAARKRASRASQAAVGSAVDRDPIGMLATQEVDRLQDLVPMRHGRMAESAFAYYRGTPVVMAADLAGTPDSGLIVQASGDAHISNFGLFASPERTLVFDANDFDETHPAPFEWDVKRMAASVVIAARANGMAAADVRTSTMASVGAYREAMAGYAGMRLMETWYDRISAEDIEADLRAYAQTRVGGAVARDRMTALNTMFTKARRRDRLKATSSLTAVVDGAWRIVDDPPVVSHIELPGETLATVFRAYRETMAENRRELVERYRFVDFALKVVGVGSVGTRCFILLLEGRDQDDPLILQVKEAVESVLEPHTAKSKFRNHGERVVVGQRLMQATPDIFLGWTRGPEGRDFYFRQLWDMKGSVDTTALRGTFGMSFYGSLCARSLARAHARSGDAVAISAYLGTSDKFDGAIADFAEAYADLNERDHAAFVAAIADGRVTAAAG